MINAKLKNKLPKNIFTVADFHWGFDPGILMTAKMCHFAMKKMKIKKGDTNIYVCSDMYRCHIDSPQVYLGCTVSSSRLSVKDFGKNSIIFYDSKKDKAQRFFLKAGYPDIFKKFVPNLSSDDAGRVMREIAFSILKIKPEDMISYENIRLSNKFKQYIKKGNLIYIPSKYYKKINQSEIIIGRSNLKVLEKNKIKNFSGRVPNLKEELLLSYIKNYVDFLSKEEDRYDIYSVSEGPNFLADAVQVLLGFTYGNKHLKLSKSTKNKAITIFSHKHNKGIRLYLKGNKIISENVLITYKFDKNYFATKRVYCDECNEIVFDSKERRMKSKNICLECDKNSFKKL